MQTRLLTEPQLLGCVRLIIDAHPAVSNLRDRHTGTSLLSYLVGVNARSSGGESIDQTGQTAYSNGLIIHLLSVVCLGICIRLMYFFRGALRLGELVHTVGAIIVDCLPLLILLAVFVVGFGLASIAFLWPQLGGGFGSAIRVGLVSDVLSEIRGANGFLYRAEGRMWITEYPNGAVEKARAAYSANELTGMEAGLALGLDGGVIALYQKCPHLGCRVPECVTSQWFECPCHGSQYNRVGEKRGGPAPRGMDRFAMSVSADGVLTVDTGTIIQGPPIGTNTTGQEAEGPNCIGQSSH